MNEVITMKEVAELFIVIVGSLFMTLIIAVSFFIHAHRYKG